MYSKFKATGLIIFLSFVLTFGLTTKISAQNTPVFTVRLIIDIKDGGLDNVWISITKNGATYRTINPNGKSKYMVDFELGAEYLITVTKPNYITKSVIVNTQIPNGRENNDFAKFDARIELNKQPEDQEITYTQPVGKIGYNYTAGDFDFDTQYIAQAKEMQKKAEANPKPKTKTPPPPPPTSNPIPVEVKQPEYKPEPPKTKPTIKEPEFPQKPIVKNKEEKSIQRDRVKITIIVVTIDNTSYEYKKEEYAWGGTYYYKNGRNITENTFEKETE